MGFLYIIKGKRNDDKKYRQSRNVLYKNGEFQEGSNLKPKKTFSELWLWYTTTDVIHPIPSVMYKRDLLLPTLPSPPHLTSSLSSCFFNLRFNLSNSPYTTVNNSSITHGHTSTGLQNLKSLITVRDTTRCEDDFWLHALRCSF
jgi:hypothetical protein